MELTGSFNRNGLFNWSSFGLKIFLYPYPRAGGIEGHERIICFPLRSLYECAMHIQDHGQM